MTTPDRVAEVMREKLRALIGVRNGWQTGLARLKQRCEQAREKIDQYGQEIADLRADAARLGISLDEAGVAT